MSKRVWLSIGCLLTGLIALALVALSGPASAQLPTGSSPAMMAVHGDGAVIATPTRTPCPLGTPGPWVVRSPQPVGLYGSAAANDGTVAYIAGGSPNGGTVINSFRSYNPATDAWADLASMPDSNAIALAAYAPNTGKLYVFGGDDFAGGVSNQTRIYNPGTNSWSAGASMPGARWGMGGGYYNGKIYVVAGFDGTSETSTTWEYDPVANSWNTARAPIPFGRDNPGSAILNGHLYIAGGRNSGTTLNNMYDYDIVGNSWTERALMPAARQAPGASAIGGKLWVFGGGAPFGSMNGARRASSAGEMAEAPLAFNNTYIYDPATDTWADGPALNVARAYIASTTIDNTAVAIGGESNFSGYLNTTETNSLPDPCSTPTVTNTPGSQTPTNTPIPPSSTSTATSTRTPRPPTSTHTAGPSPTPTQVICPPGPPGPFAVASPIPTAAEGMGVAAVGNLAYAAGGYVSGNVIDRFASYNPATNSWTTLAPMPTAADSPSLVYAPNVNKMYAFGGDDNSGNGLTTNRIYDLSTSAWSTGAPMPAGRTFMASGYYDGKIYLVGGSASIFTGGESQVWEYDPVANTYDTTRAGIPQGVGGAAYGIVSAHLYLMGGFNPAGDRLNIIYDYDIFDDSWTTDQATLFSAISSAGSAVLGNRIMLMGGFSIGPNSVAQVNRGVSSSKSRGDRGDRGDGGNVRATTYIFNPSADIVTGGPNLNEARDLVGGTFVNRYVLAVGGHNGTTFVGTTEVSSAPPLCPTATPTFTNTPPSPTPTSTPTRTNTVIAPPSSTANMTTTAVATATATGAATSETPTVSATVTVCTISFSDVPEGSAFYSFIRCLACRGIISGYSDGTFHPNIEITRGQIAKIVSNAAGFEEDPGPQIYEDVNTNNNFYQWVNRLSNRGFMGGYPCGTIDPEPCVPPDNRPYFRPFANTTRGQLAKIVSNAAGVGGSPTGLFYTDVPEDNPFYLWVMRLTDLGVMSGYDCGGPGEPCDDQQRPYFRPFTNVTRGQASKIVANTFFPNCQTPAR